ncbi:hypothetical protein [Glycomyces buryatensis]|uniref:hypothetical protein n=1 Tax=Glycomyces buryatensis TaxID=2570927 RepID=UPI0014562EE3|nr:hypothetical protein [Glycomyces buryatensis]
MPESFGGGHLELLQRRLRQPRARRHLPHVLGPIPDERHRTEQPQRLRIRGVDLGVQRLAVLQADPPRQLHRRAVPKGDEPLPVRPPPCPGLPGQTSTLERPPALCFDFEP